MPIKIEILADNPADLMDQLRGLLIGGQNPGPMPWPPLNDVAGSAVLAGDPAWPPLNDVAGSAVLAGDPAYPDEPPKPKRRHRKKAGGNGGVKPLPDEDDPLSASEPDEAEDEPEPEEDDPFTEPSVEPDRVALVKQATEKLRDLFKLNAAGIAGVRKLRDKYKVTYFHQVPVERASELWNDALALASELGQ